MSDITIPLGDIVHRLSNMLGTIPMNVAYVREMHADLLYNDRRLEEVLSNIERDAYDALSFIHTLRNTFVIPRELQALELWPVLEKALARSRIPTNVTVVRDNGKDLPKVLGTDKLISVFENLISNAIEAMSDGGVLNVHVDVAQDNEKVVVTIRDTGVGVPQDLQDKIFNRIVSTKRGNQGLGLWWSRLYLQQIEGDIGFESQVGEGSSFAVTLQVSQ